ncbi:hypothetical protein PSHT_10019, partial [Puccinia striiformis]
TNQKEKMTGQFNTFSQASTAPLHSKPDPKLQTKQTIPATNPDGLDSIKASKQLAAYAAVNQHILPHHWVIGIGRGSTVPYVLKRNVQQGHKTNKSRVNSKSRIKFRRYITLDGADEVDADLNVIKGGGACYSREIVLAEAADKFILVADAQKDSALLGTNWRTLRMGKSKAGPVVTDNGNFIIDAPFDEIQPNYLTNSKCWSSHLLPIISKLAHRENHPRNKEEQIKTKKADPLFFALGLCRMTGLLEVVAEEAYFGNLDGTVIIQSKNGKTQKMSVEEGKAKTQSNGHQPQSSFKA